MLIFADLVVWSGERRLLRGKPGSRDTAEALLRGGLAHAPRKASARSENQHYHLTEPYKKIGRNYE